MPGVFEDEDVVETPQEKKVDVNQLKIPDDHEDETLRGKTVSQLVNEMNTLKATARSAIDHSTAVAAAAARAMPHANQPAPQRAAEVDPNEYLITNEDLLAQDTKTLNDKVQRMFEAKATPLLLEQYQNSSIVALQASRNDKRNMPYFEHFEQEIMQLAAQRKVNETARLDTWYKMYNEVVARHQPEITEHIVQQRLAEERAKASPPVPQMERGRGGAVASSPTLTDDEKRVATQMGVSFEDYLKHKGA